MPLPAEEVLLLIAALAAEEDESVDCAAGLAVLESDLLPSVVDDWSELFPDLCDVSVEDPVVLPDFA